jgi:hypothetical protein
MIDSARNSTDAEAINTPVPLPAATKQEKHRLSFFHKSAAPVSPSPLTESKGKEKETGPYSDIGQSELSLELLDKSHGVGHSNQTLDGAGVVSIEAPKYPALDIRNLPQDVLPGSDQTTFSVIRQGHSELSVQDNGTISQETLSSFSDEQAIIEYCEDVQNSEIVSQETLSISSSGQTFVSPGEHTIPFPALDPSIIPTVVLPEDPGLDGAGDKLRRMHLSPYEAEVSAYKHDVDPRIGALDSDYDTIFTPIRLDIVVQPRINGSLDNKLFGRAVYQSLIGTSNYMP